MPLLFNRLPWDVSGGKHLQWAPERSSAFGFQDERQPAVDNETLRFCRVEFILALKGHSGGAWSRQGERRSG